MAEIVTYTPLSFLPSFTLRDYMTYVVEQVTADYRVYFLSEMKQI